MSIIRLLVPNHLLVFPKFKDMPCLIKSDQIAEANEPLLVNILQDVGEAILF